MYKSRLLGAVCACLFTFGLVASVDAALIGRLQDTGGIFQAVYDTEQQITQLANAHLADTETFGVGIPSRDRWMDWDRADSWINGMNNDAYLQIENWRLPEIDKLNSLYYVGLGARGGSVLDTGDPDELAKFYNIKENLYQSGTSGGTPPSFAPTYWGFDFRTGRQGNYVHGVEQYALPVVNGDVFAPVPIPPSVWLFGSGLLGLVRIARCKKAS